MKNKTDRRRNLERSIEYWKDIRLQFVNLPIIGGYALHAEIASLIGSKVEELKKEYLQLTGKYYDPTSIEKIMNAAKEADSEGDS